MLETVEEEAVTRLRKRYEENGYKFLDRPQPKQIPAFLGGHVPDAIALGPKESVIIEIVSTKRTAKRSAVVKFFASEVPKHKGWRFELVVAEPEDDDAAEPDRRQLKSELRKVRDLSESGDPKHALVLAWALLEATTRRLVLNSRTGASRRHLPRSVVEALVTEGFASDDEGERLLDIAMLRNRLAHGFSNLSVERKELQFLIELIDRLLSKTR